MSAATAITISQEAALACIERAISVRFYFPANLESAAGAPTDEASALRADEGHACTISEAIAACCRMGARRFLINGVLVIYPHADETRCVVRSDGPNGDRGSRP